MAQQFDDGTSLAGQPSRIATYADAEREGVLLLGLSPNQLLRVSNTAEIEIELKNDFDKQRHKHQNFGRKKFLGISLAQISVGFVVLPDEEQEFWDKIVPLFRPRGKNGVSTALNVFNYQMNRTGIMLVNVLTSKIGPPNPRTGRKVSLRLEEWTAAPTKPKAGADSKQPAEKLDVTPGGLAETRAGQPLKTPLGGNQ